MNFHIDCSTPTGPFKPFWASTGFTPATLLLTSDMRQQVTYWGSIPREGLKYARVHYLLELVDVTFEGETPARVDWSRLDQGLDLLVQNGLSPIFELMGNPNGQFTDFNDALQLRRWRNLVRELALHVTARYGPAEVEDWFFETWNEPDIGFGWSQQWPQDEVSFCRYYDACVDGLAAANPRLRIGGPGTCRTLSSLFLAFLAHCEATGARLDFISVHEKGVKAHKEDLNPRTDAMIEREARIIQAIRQRHPRLAALPFMNNECDPQVGWKDHHTWHARPYYAAWVCKSVVRHLEALVDALGVDYGLLGNDHGFIGEWGQRTLLARFGPPGWIEDGQSGHAGRRGWAERDFTTPNFAMIKKPVFNAMTLLSLLGDERLACRVSGELAQPAGDADLGVLATRAGSQAVAVLVYYSRDRIVSQGSQRVTLRLEGLPFDSAMLAHYRIDETHGDPYALWEAAGAPANPDDRLLDAMRAAQEPALDAEPVEVSLPEGRLELAFDLPLHGVSLILLLARPDEPPARASGLRAEAYIGLNGRREYLLRWDPLPSRAIRTYEVLRAPQPGGPYRRVNQPDLTCSAYLHAGEPGYFKVVATDFWGRSGEASEPVELT